MGLLPIASPLVSYVFIKEDKQMKRTFTILLILSFAVIILLGPEASSKAAEQKDKSTQANDVPKRRHKRFELPDEKVDRIINRLKETDPEKAEELAKPRTEDPEKFKAELKEAVRAGVVKRVGPRKKPAVKPDFGPGVRQGAWHSGPKDEISDLMNKKYDEHLEWLRENYPQQAETLSKLKENQPDTYREQIALSLKEYGEIAEASKNNPQLAEMLKEGLGLKEQRDKLLEKIRVTTDEGEKEKLVRELEGVVSRNFALVAKRKQIEHEQLLKKLEKLQEKIKQSEAEVKKWEDAKFRNKETKAHVEDLISGKENLK